jgi:benzoylformate decarboxylase
VWASPMSARCSFPERHPLFAGFLPPMRERIVELLKSHDLIVVLGAPVFTYHVEGFGPHVPAGSQLFQIIDEPQTAAHSPVGTTIVCSVREAMRDLLMRPNAGVRPTVQGRLPPRRIADDATLISAAYLMQTLAALRPADSIIVEESPSTRPVMQDRLPIERPNSFHTCASGGLGHALPAAVGIALANATSRRRVIALIGDGSALYSIQSLWSAAQWRLPMTIVIVNNHRYRALDEFAAHFGVRAPVGMQLPGLDFVALARGQGVSARRVSLASELPSAIAESLESPQPRLLDVEVSEG